jgi:hypothetical protein
MLAETDAELAWLRAKVAVERRNGIDSRVLGANELRSMAPWAGRPFLGATFCAGEGQIDPLRGTLAVRMLALRAGARLAEGVEVRAIARDGHGHCRCSLVRPQTPFLRPGHKTPPRGGAAGVKDRRRRPAQPARSVLEAGHDDKRRSKRRGR